MAREQKAVADLEEGDEVYTPTSRHARELLRIKDDGSADEPKRTLVFEGISWTLPVSSGDGAPRMIDVEISDLPPADQAEEAGS